MQFSIEKWLRAQSYPFFHMFLQPYIIQNISEWFPRFNDLAVLTLFEIPPPRLVISTSDSIFPVLLCSILAFAFLFFVF